MNLNLGVNLPRSQGAQDLYRLAYHCAYSHAAVKCNTCNVCTYNIERYGWEPNEVRLIKARALIDYQESVGAKKQGIKTYWQIEAGIVIAVVILLVFLILGMRWMDRVSAVYTPPQTIEEATALVRANLRDVNFDDRVNCIDNAVIFYEYWPDSKIIRAWDNDGYNHLLNMVNGQYIEPQVRSGDPLILWSKQFPTAFKKDETNLWGWWATRRRW